MCLSEWDSNLVPGETPGTSSAVFASFIYISASCLWNITYCLQDVWVCDVYVEAEMNVNVCFVSENVIVLLKCAVFAVVYLGFICMRCMNHTFTHSSITHRGGFNLLAWPFSGPLHSGPWWMWWRMWCTHTFFTLCSDLMSQCKWKGSRSRGLFFHFLCSVFSCCR